MPPKAALITDTTLASLYIKTQTPDLHLIAIPPGEGLKTLSTVEKIGSSLIAACCGKKTPLIAFGGGVITDLTAFIASIFCRGAPLILIPTTLLAMVDAAIGGKTAVNLPEGKNLLGSYYFPQKIVISPFFLQTLPDAEWENGLVEIIKIGLVANPDLFYLFSHMPLKQLIFSAIEAKRRIIASDPYETGCRVYLNFGHTIGHALETLSQYTISHGKAVATGIIIESRLSHALGLLPKEDLHTIEKTLPPLYIPFSPEQIISQLPIDKKSENGKPHFVLLKKIGVPHIQDGRFCHPVSNDLVLEILYDACLCPS